MREFHVGVESGSDEVLRMMDKGVTTKEIMNAFDPLDIRKLLEEN